MSDTDYAAVLSVIRPGAPWTLVGNNYSTLVWLDDSPKPTKKTLDDAWPQTQWQLGHDRIEAERRARYQAETDGIYFEAVRGDGNLDAWRAATAQIRADLPYPEMPA
jgi:hypothetical protein